jgi:hypothetical protein
MLKGSDHPDPRGRRLHDIHVVHLFDPELLSLVTIN